MARLFTRDGSRVHDRRVLLAFECLNRRLGHEENAFSVYRKIRSQAATEKVSMGPESTTPRVVDQ